MTCHPIRRRVPSLPVAGLSALSLAVLTAAVLAQSVLSAPALAYGSPPTSRSATPLPQTPHVAYVGPALAEVIARIEKDVTGYHVLSSAQDFVALRTAILADNQVSANERDLIEEIMYRYGRVNRMGARIRLRWAGTENPVLVDGNALSLVLRPEFTENVLFEDLQRLRDFTPIEISFDPADRPGSLRRLFDASLQTPEATPGVRNALAEEVARLWAESTVENGYSPVRGFISDAMGVVNTYEGDDNAAVRGLLYDSIVQGAEGAPLTMPRFLYNWIRPGGHTGPDRPGPQQQQR